MDYIREETEETRKFFKLEDILEIQSKKDIQLKRLEDGQYGCFINGEVYQISLTPMNALSIGVYKFLNLRN